MIEEQLHYVTIQKHRLMKSGKDNTQEGKAEMLELDKKRDELIKQLTQRPLK